MSASATASAATLILGTPSPKKTMKGTVSGKFSWFYCQFVGPQLHMIARVVYIAARACLHQFAVQVNHFSAASHLVQVVHILCHYRHVVVLLEFSHKQMPLVWLHIGVFGAQHIVESIHILGVSLPTLMRCDALHRIVLP